MSRLRDEIAALRRSLADNADALETVERQDSQLRRIADDRTTRSLLKGRISFYLESADRDGKLGDLREQLARVERQVAELAARLDGENIRAHTDSILSRISVKMGEIAAKLNIEYAGDPLRLDLSAVTVVADAQEGPVPLNRMGGGKTHLACHLASHIALHDWFARNSRPVPGFLMPDQPLRSTIRPTLRLRKTCGRIQE